MPCTKLRTWKRWRRKDTHTDKNTAATTTFNNFSNGITLAQPNNVFGPLAISQAVNVRVGYYVGQQSPHAARSAGIAAFTLGVGFMAAMAAMLLTIPPGSP